LLPSEVWYKDLSKTCALITKSSALRNFDGLQMHSPNALQKDINRLVDSCTSSRKVTLPNRVCGVSPISTSLRICIMNI